MNKAKIAYRTRAAASAVGSVRAEGLNPSEKTQKLIDQYVSGEITSSQLRAQTIKDVKKAHKQ